MNTPTVTIVVPSTGLLGLQSHNTADIKILVGYKMKFWSAPKLHWPVREIEAIVYGRIMGEA